MPSNTMKISQLIARLRQEQDVHGDLDVVLQVSELGASVALDGRNINVALDLPTGKLPQPALVFGIWKDELGNLTNSPGQAYQVTMIAETTWNYARDAAPEGENVEVWKRYGGSDKGYRVGPLWYVFEGGDSPIEIIPDGVLAWRMLH